MKTLLPSLISVFTYSSHTDSDKHLLHRDAKRLFSEHGDEDKWDPAINVRYKSYQQARHHAECNGTAFASVVVTFSSLPYYTQIHRTAFFPLSPILSQGLLYFYDLIWLTRSYLVAFCPVRYSSGAVIRSLMYDTHLRATHTTTSSIGGVQIPICLVDNATDSL